MAKNQSDSIQNINSIEFELSFQSDQSKPALSEVFELIRFNPRNQSE